MTSEQFRRRAAIVNAGALVALGVLLAGMALVSIPGAGVTLYGARVTYAILAGLAGIGALVALAGIGALVALAK
jgi:hypothetical protein